MSVRVQETTVAEEQAAGQHEDSLMRDLDDGVGRNPDGCETKNARMKKAPKAEAAHEQLLGYLALIDPEFPTTEDEETGEQQVLCSPHV